MRNSNGPLARNKRMSWSVWAVSDSCQSACSSSPSDSRSAAPRVTRSTPRAISAHGSRTLFFQSLANVIATGATLGCRSLARSPALRSPPACKRCFSSSGVAGKDMRLVMGPKTFESREIIDAFMKPIFAILLAFCPGLRLDLRGAVPEAAAPPPATTPAPPPSAPAKRSAAELEKLAMPIALHPDPLVSIILPASVYPVEIIMAARFVKDTNNIPKVDAQPWDENVEAVAKFPELIAKMDADLDWTVALGQAFLEQRKELMDTIQSLRLKAQQAGMLQTTEQQIIVVTNTVVEKIVEQRAVVVTNTIVQIQPSNPEVIYVPSYPPTV